MPELPHSDWDHSNTLDQFLSLLRSAVEHQQVTNSLRQAPPDFSPLLKALLAEHRQRFPANPSPPVANMTIASFLSINYKQVLRSLPLSGWSGLLAALHPETIPLTHRETADVTRLSQCWATLESSSRRKRIEGVGALIDHLAHLLDWLLVRRHTLGHETVYSFRMPHLRLADPPTSVLLTFINSEEQTSPQRAATWTQDLLAHTPGLGSSSQTLVINLLVGPLTSIAPYKENLRSRNDLVFCDEAALKEIFSADRYHAKLEEIVRRNISLERLNPYNSEKPVSQPAMFFGREHEIGTILATTKRDFAVVGSRKIGKSSLLLRLQQLCEPQMTRIPIYLECAEKSVEEVAELLALKISPRRSKRLQLGHVSQMIRSAHSIRGIPFLLLLDEIDAMVNQCEKSADWRIFSILRELSSAGLLQVVMTGYRPLYAAWQSRSTPLFNFVNPLYLSALSPESAQRLVKAPLEGLGVAFSSADLINQIVNETGSHPSFLQFFCSELLKTLSRRGARHVTPTDLDAVRLGMAYREFVLKPFRRHDDLSELERWLVLALVHAQLHVFDPEGIYDQFRAAGDWITASAVARALQNLELSGIIRERLTAMSSPPAPNRVQYSWTIPAFPVVFERTANVARELSEVEGRLKQKRLWSEIR